MIGIPQFSKIDLSVLFGDSSHVSRGGRISKTAARSARFAALSKTSLIHTMATEHPLGNYPRSKRLAPNGLR